MSNESRISSRQVVEAIYLFEKDDPYKTKFTADEESAMLLWQNVLTTTHAQEMVDIGYQQLEDNVTMSQYNVPYQDLRSWIESYEETVWSALQKTQGYVTVAPEAHVSLHLLCYMVSLAAVAKRAQQLFSVQDTKSLLKQLAEYAWHDLLTKTGTSLTPRDIKLIPQKDFFENMMGKLIGVKSTVTVLSFLRQWGNRIWFSIFGTPIRPAHACLLLCLSVCAVLALYYLPTGHIEKNRLVGPTDSPQNQRIYEQVRKNLTKFM